MASVTVSSAAAIRPGCVSRSISARQRFSAAPSLMTRRQERLPVRVVAASGPVIPVLGSVAPSAALAAGSSPEMVANQVFTIADQMSPETAGLISAVLGPVFAVGTLLMTLRIITTWYPETNGNKMPWLLVYFPTEWILAPTRKVVPPSFGVDISPVVWVAIISFLNEILLGPQGILNLIIRQQLASQ